MGADVKLSANWKQVLKKAWSIRFMIAAGTLSGVEVALPFFASAMPHGVFATLSGISVGAAFVARLVAQKDV